MTKSGQEHVVRRHVLLGIVTEDRATIVRAIVLGVVQPALRVVRVLTTQTETNDVCRGVREATGKALVTHPGQESVKW